LLEQRCRMMNPFKFAHGDTWLGASQGTVAKWLRGLSLTQHLLLVLTPVPLLLAGVLVLQLIDNSHRQADPAQERGLAMVRLLAPAAELGVAFRSPPHLNHLLETVLTQDEVVSVAIYDHAGEQIVAGGRAGSVAPALLSGTASARFMGERNGRLAFAAPVMVGPAVLDDIASASMDPELAVASNVIGWVYVELDTAPPALQQDKFALASLALALLMLALSAYLTLRLARLAKRDETSGQFAYQALHDPLTGLPNRRAFDEALNEAVSASRRASDQCALCFIDLDHFKIVNDAGGHAAGDAMLREVAGLIRQRVRTQDEICRIGGDEFGLILRGCNAEVARRIADGLCDAIASLRFEWEGECFTFSASFGLAYIDGSVNSTTEVLKAADAACYAAKRQGRNQVVVAQDNSSVAPGMHSVLPYA
jgi:diguanylate cyclase (GGDEF)-like protein